MVITIKFRCEAGDIKKIWSCLREAYISLFSEWVCDKNFAPQEIISEGQLPKEYWKDANVFGKVKVTIES